MATEIFASYEEFEKRPNKKTNGVSPAFVADYPSAIDNDDGTNVGCWNCVGCYCCEGCYDCHDCINCIDCHHCVDCKDCSDCVICGDMEGASNITCGDRS